MDTQLHVALLSLHEILISATPQPSQKLGQKDSKKTSTNTKNDHFSEVRALFPTNLDPKNKISWTRNYMWYYYFFMQF